MPPKSKDDRPKRNKLENRKPKTAQERMRARRARLRAQGLRPVQFWVPDLRDPKVRADIRRQGELLARHSENAEIDAWIEAVVDTSEWK
jgi:hypothetical protein